jgi:hypothetical protein
VLASYLRPVTDQYSSLDPQSRSATKTPNSPFQLGDLRILSEGLRYRDGSDTQLDASPGWPSAHI